MIKLAIEEVFSLSIKLKKFLPIHIPTSLRDPIWATHSRALLVALEALLCHLGLLTTIHSRLGNGHSTESPSSPLMSVRQVICAYTLSFYPLGYYCYCFDCWSILFLLATMWKKPGHVSGTKYVGISFGMPPWPIQAELYVSFLMLPWLPILLPVIFLTLYFNHLFTRLFSSLNSELKSVEKVVFFFLFPVPGAKQWFDNDCNEWISSNQLNPSPSTFKCRPHPNCY